MSVASERSSRVMPCFSSSALPWSASSWPSPGGERLGVLAVLGGVEEVDDAADVLRDDVDALRERRHVGVPGVDELDVGAVAGLREQLVVHRGDQRGLGEVLARDRHRALVARPGRRGCRRRAWSRGRRRRTPWRGGWSRRRAPRRVSVVPAWSPLVCPAAPEGSRVSGERVWPAAQPPTASASGVQPRGRLRRFRVSRPAPADRLRVRVDGALQRRRAAARATSATSATTTAPASPLP